MTDHTRTEKISGDSIYFGGHPSRAGNLYDSLATPLGLRKSDQYFCHMLSSVVIRMLSLSFVSICIAIMPIFFSHLHIMFNNCGVHLWFGL